MLQSLVRTHEQLRAFYDEWAEDASDPRVTAVLERSAERASRAGAILGSPDGNPVLDHWLQFDAMHEVRRHLEAFEIDADASPAQVLSDTLELERQLAEAFEALRGASASPRVRHLFEQLLQHQEARARELARADADMAP